MGQVDVNAAGERAGWSGYWRYFAFNDLKIVRLFSQGIRMGVFGGHNT